MTKVKPAKPCPSDKENKPKVNFLLATMTFLARFYRVLKLCDAIFEWFKSHQTSVWEWVKGFGDMF